MVLSSPAPHLLKPSSPLLSGGSGGLHLGLSLEDRRRHPGASSGWSNLRPGPFFLPPASFFPLSSFLHPSHSPVRLGYCGTPIRFRHKDFRSARPQEATGRQRPEGILRKDAGKGRRPPPYRRPMRISATSPRQKSTFVERFNRCRPKD
ncbi:hypothetical protein HMPREF9440_00672 [Sutterella parvirubra YIT 11816]|uniref:Uncharacterized protein n=1 Tax=Sutterella parvirubra YIT 11816 TaxID=762967 RepID=H3KD66_9BURK|nr:hypothetical protein HMPREF9440_00672 [Sutterella parvirubra YIT 11816]